MIFLRMFRNGRLSNLGTALLGVVGIGLIAYTLLLAESRWLGLVSFFLGCGLLGFAGLSNSAASIGLKPFTRDPLGWRKAKQSYEADAKQDAASDDQEKDR